jgi:protein CpxP
MNLKNSKIVKGIAAGVLALGVSAVLVTATLVARQDDGGGRQRHFGRMHRGFGGFDGMALRQLDLTDAQREQIRSIFEQNRDEMRAAGEKLRTARRGLHDAAGAGTVANAGTVDEAAIRTAAESLANAEAEAAINRARVHAQVWQLLTPEQQAKAKELRQQREQRRSERQKGEAGR